MSSKFGRSVDARHPNVSVPASTLHNVTSCNVLKCPKTVDETIKPPPFVGPLCDDHRARVLSGEDFELRGSEESATGTAHPTVLMDDSLRSLDQYVLLIQPDIIESGNHHGHLVPLQVRHRGGGERELDLLIPPEMLATIAQRFQHWAERFGKGSE